jgi:hypothetical protein
LPVTRVTSTSDGATASITLKWAATTASGGVALTGYRLYQIDEVAVVTTLAYDGTDHPEVLETTITGLTLD